MEKLYTTEEAAKLLGISPDTLYVWKCTKRYSLPVIKVGRLNKYSHSSLLKFLQDRTVDGKMPNQPKANKNRIVNVNFTGVYSILSIEKYLSKNAYQVL